MFKKAFYLALFIAVIGWIVWYVSKPPLEMRQMKVRQAEKEEIEEVEEIIDNADLNSVTQSGAEWNMVARQAIFKKGGSVIVLKDATIIQDNPKRKMIAEELTLYLDENKKVMRAVAKGRPTFWF